MDKKSMDKGNWFISYWTILSGQRTKFCKNSDRFYYGKKGRKNQQILNICAVSSKGLETLREAFEFFAVIIDHVFLMHPSKPVPGASSAWTWTFFFFFVFDRNNLCPFKKLKGRRLEKENDILFMFCDVFYTVALGWQRIIS